MSNFWEWSKDVSFVNRFIFPAPKPPSYNKDSFPDELLFVPPKEKLYQYYKQFKMEQLNKNKGIPNNKYDINSPKYNHKSPTKPNTNNTTNALESKQQYCDENSIPCIYIERKYRLSEATHLLLYLHGNAEDLGKCYPIIDYIRMKLQVNILAPEYPGYGVSAGDACENSVAEMVQNVYEFAISPYGLNVPPSRIIIYGFSIGSAAALSVTNFSLRKVYIPLSYNNNNKRNKHKHKNKKKKRAKKHKNINDFSSSDDENKNNNEEKKYELSLLNYNYNNHKDKNGRNMDMDMDMNMNKNANGNGKHNKAARKYFLSTCLKTVPHKQSEHDLLFPNMDNTHFYTSDSDNIGGGDPFERLPLASLLNILRKGNVAYPTSVNKQELLSVARKHGLIPPLKSCKKANVIRKYSLLIIVCPFASISQVVADKIGVFASYLLSERFKNIEAVKKVHGPLLIMHGKDDSIIPYQHSIEIHKTAQACDIQPTHLELLDGCDHNTMDLRKITNIINKFFKHQFNLCKSSKRMNVNANVNVNNGYDASAENVGSTPYANAMNNMKYPKTNHNNGRIINEFIISIPSYCWLKPEQEAQELTEEDKDRLKKKQEQDDEEYAFNLFMKQLLQHENISNASAAHLQPHQHIKLGKFFGDPNSNENHDNHHNMRHNEQSQLSQSHTVISNSNISSSSTTNTNVVEENELNDENTNQSIEPEYSLSHALRLQPHDIILPPDSSSN